MSLIRCPAASPRSECLFARHVCQSALIFILFAVACTAAIFTLDLQLRHLILKMTSRLTLLKGKRIFIKDIIHYIVCPDGKPATIAPSLQRIKRGVGTKDSSSAETNGTESLDGIGLTAPYPFDTEAEPGNPTVVPTEMLAKFHFTFLIRDPHSSIPSYYRCTVPPLDKVTGFYDFYPSEAGYDELRRVFEYLQKIGLVGPRVSGTIDGSAEKEPNGMTVASSKDHSNGFELAGADICVVDADDLLDNPTGIIEAFCKSVGMKYEPDMLSWDDEEHLINAKKTFEKWKGFHEDAINSKGLAPRTHVSIVHPHRAPSGKVTKPSQEDQRYTKNRRRRDPRLNPNGMQNGSRSMVQKRQRPSGRRSIRIWMTSIT